MVKRLYADNFGCLVNFDLKLDRLNLFLGENGSGKTTVFEVLHRLRQFMLGNQSINRCFPAKTLTRWQTKTTQNFEMELQVGEETYRYQLSVDHEGITRRANVRRESLSIGDLPVFMVQDGLVRLLGNESRTNNEFPFDPGQSVVGSFLLGDNKRLLRFKKEIEKIVVCSLEPMNMLASSSGEARLPARNLKNFVSWYRYLSQEYQGSILHLIQELRAVLKGFHSFSLQELGEETREMKVHFHAPDIEGDRTTYSFKELSDGQRVLIVLYTLIYGLAERGAYLFLDEPENFVALREIQPWLHALIDQLGGPIKQAVLISHHPEMIDYLGKSAGCWFERDTNGPARANSQAPEGLQAWSRPSEAVARGWER